ncbi:MULTISPECIES: peptide MFS transporter [Sphingopyxis]|jgi:POT family proton-dependent oligopeptide transporter|uniref:peptide MFS transporter n=1 Tax=Sphingopyxis TaxID=165697 RepID=UPI0002D17AD0|nr:MULTISPECIES: peptide MFS transporter [Sphingopyxis]ENY81503.1 di-tripeptide ABC transporter-like protein [Sphingopyxis sp. MC1]MBN8803587.1 peptide MFS transporter [Sphingopyxis terrae]MDX8358116.1 peptide MFS transporter [Sphingopyxis terrae]
MKDMALWDEGDWIAVIALVILGVFLSIGALVAASKKPEFAGHPKGLYMLFFAEMWERFSYYGMRALLIFYLTQHWLFSDGKSNLIYGAYTALVYITPVLGGYLADRYLGQRKAVLFGGVLLAFGHLFMAFEGDHGITDAATKQADPAINIFWLALALIIVGSGFLKANISVMVGQLYRLTDMRRDAAYTIFYMGINVGAALGTILVGYLGQKIGWAYGFGLAGIGMVAGLIVFVLGKNVLLGAGEAPAPLAKSKEWSIYGVGLVAVGVMWALVQYQDVIQTLLVISGLGLLGWVLFQAFKLEKEPRERIFAILFLIALNPLFWGLFEQAGGSFNLYTDRYVDKGGVPASVFQSINPIYIILFAPVFAALWQWLGKRGLEPSAPAKFALALAQVGAGFLVFVWGASSVGPEVATPVLFVFLLYLLHTTGELCLSPVGLSAMNRLAPSFMASLIMGAWFYMTAVGNFVAGKIGEATGGESGDMTKEATLAIYQEIGLITIGVSVVVLALSPIVKKWMHLDTLRDRDDSVAGAGELAEPQAAGTHPEPKGA